MLQESFLRVYEKLKSEFCRQVFALVRERRGSLSAMEAFSLEVIRQLGRPTVSQFAAFLNISQSNATYKVASLVRKGYLLKENSGADRREYYLWLRGRAGARALRGRAALREPPRRAGDGALRRAAGRAGGGHRRRRRE